MNMGKWNIRQRISMNQKQKKKGEVREGGDPERTDMQSCILPCWMIRTEWYPELDGEEGRLLLRVLLILRKDKS